MVFIGQIWYNHGQNFLDSYIKMFFTIYTSGGISMLQKIANALMLCSFFPAVYSTQITNPDMVLVSWIGYYVSLGDSESFSKHVYCEQYGDIFGLDTAPDWDAHPETRDPGGNPPQEVVLAVSDDSRMVYFGHYFGSCDADMKNNLAKKSENTGTPSNRGVFLVFLWILPENKRDRKL